MSPRMSVLQESHLAFKLMKYATTMERKRVLGGGRGHKHCFNRDSAGAIQRIRANGAKRRNRSCRMCLSFHRLLESKYDTSVHVHNILGLKKPRGLCLLSLVYSTRRSLQRALIVRNSH